MREKAHTFCGRLVPSPVIFLRASLAITAASRTDLRMAMGAAACTTDRVLGDTTPSPPPSPSPPESHPRAPKAESARVTAFAQQRPSAYEMSLCSPESLGYRGYTWVRVILGLLVGERRGVTAPNVTRS